MAYRSNCIDPNIVSLILFVLFSGTCWF